MAAADFPPWHGRESPNLARGEEKKMWQEKGGVVEGPPPWPPWPPLSPPASSPPPSMELDIEAANMEVALQMLPGLAKRSILHSS